MIRCCEIINRIITRNYSYLKPEITLNTASGWKDEYQMCVKQSLKLVIVGVHESVKGVLHVFYN